MFMVMYLSQNLPKPSFGIRDRLSQKSNTLGVLGFWDSVFVPSVQSDQVQDQGLTVAGQFAPLDHRISGAPERVLGVALGLPSGAKVGGSLIVVASQRVNDER